MAIVSKRIVKTEKKKPNKIESDSTVFRTDIISKTRTLPLLDKL